MGWIHSGGVWSILLYIEGGGASGGRAAYYMGESTKLDYIWGNSPHPLDPHTHSHIHAHP